MSGPALLPAGIEHPNAGRCLRGPVYPPPPCPSGEINTLRGNVNWMKSRQGVMKCEHLGMSSERTLQKVGSPSGARLRKFLLQRAGRSWGSWGQLLQVPGSAKVSCPLVLPLSLQSHPVFAASLHRDRVPVDSHVVCVAACCSRFSVKSCLSSCPPRHALTPRLAAAAHRAAQPVGLRLFRRRAGAACAHGTRHRAGEAASGFPWAVSAPVVPTIPLWPRPLGNTRSIGNMRDWTLPACPTCQLKLV